MREKWPGGYIHRQQDGRTLFIIERMVGGKRWHVSTRTHSLRAAMKQLERFEQDPAGYSPAGDPPEAPLHLTAELGVEFFRWQTETRGVTRKHASEVKGRLVHWIEDLGGVDLRKATLRDHIKPALDRRQTARGARISTIKAFYAWLRKEKHLLTSGEDPTLDLPVPQAQPEKRRRRKAVEFERVQAAAEHLTPEYRDLLTVAAATGWHFTELERFVRQPESQVVKVKRGKTIAVLVTLHKSRDLTRTPVTDADVLAAAERAKARGGIPSDPKAALEAACKAAGVEPFSFGVLRHSVATWSIERGAVPALVSKFLGHKDPRTLARFYEDVAVPEAPVDLPKLTLVKG